MRGATELIGITKHVIKRNFSDSREFVVPDFAVDDSASPGVQSTNDGTCRLCGASAYETRKAGKTPTLEFDRSDDFNSHDGFQDPRPGLLERLAEGTDGRESECQFRGIDSVECTILQGEAAAGDRISR